MQRGAPYLLSVVSLTALVAPVAVAERYLSYSCYEDDGLYPVEMGCRCNVGYFGSSILDDNGDYVSQDCTACPVAGTTAWDDKAARSDCMCVAGYSGDIVDGASDEDNSCSPCPEHTFSPAAMGGADCMACPDFSGTGTRTGRSQRGDCLCDAQYTGDMGALNMQLPITGAHPVHTGAVASIDAEAYGGANSVTLAEADTSISAGQTLQLADAGGNTCAATPKGSNLVVAAVEGAVIYFSTDLTRGDADAAANCMIVRAAPTCTNLANQDAGWTTWSTMEADGWVKSEALVVRTDADTPVPDSQCVTHTGGESFYGFESAESVGAVSWRFKEEDGPGYAHLDFGNCWTDDGVVEATITRVRNSHEYLLGSAGPSEPSVEVEFKFEAGDILTLRDTGTNSVITVNSLLVCAHGDVEMYRDEACVSCEDGKYKDSRGPAPCTPIVDCEGSWSEWTSSQDLCADGTDAYGVDHNNLESRVYTITQPYFTPDHGVPCDFNHGTIETRVPTGPARYSGDRWLTVDVTVEDREGLPDTQGGTGAVRVVVVTIIPVAHADDACETVGAPNEVCIPGEDNEGTVCDADGTESEKYCVTDAAGDFICTNCAGLLTDESIGIDPPRVTIDEVPVKLKESDRVAFTAERAVTTGDCRAPDDSDACDQGDGGTEAACLGLTDGAGEPCDYWHQPRVSVMGLRSCGADVLEKSHEFSGLGHFRVWLPADPATPPPDQY